MALRTAFPTEDLLRAWDAAEDPFTVSRYRGVGRVDEVAHHRGRTNLLFTAAHAVAHLREGRVKVADIGTGGLAITLARFSGAHALTQDGIAVRDANWYQDATMKADLDDLLPALDTVLDLHGMKDCYGIDVCIGTGTDPAVGLVDEVRERLLAVGLTVSINDPYDATPEHTITNHTRRSGHAACQLELSRTTRTRGTRQATAFLSAMLDFASAQ